MTTNYRIQKKRLESNYNSDKRNIWYLHPYAGGPGVGRFSRPYYLSANWQKNAVQATVFCPTFHHLLDKPREPGKALVGDVRYHFVQAREYTHNGFSRLANMAEFSAAMLHQAESFAHIYGEPDAIIGSSPHPYIFLASHRIARRFGAISIFEVRDLWPLSLVELAGVNPRHPLVLATGWLEKYAYRNADFVVSLHPHNFQHMAERGIDATRWRYIPNGVDTEEFSHFQPGGPAHNRILTWRADGKFVVLYAGALGPPNNVDILIRAAAQLRSEGDDKIRILIVGRGESQSELASLIDELDLRDCVGLYSQVSKPHALALMKAADAGYISLKPMPIFRHGISPNKLYDYMLAQLPIVSAIAAANDPVTEANCGITVAPGDIGMIISALRQLANLKPADREALGRNGRAYALNHHDYSKLAADYAELFRK